jgi:site-specific DNA-methyltransferase (adenine-specific)
MEDASVDAIVTDPPAGIGFMGKNWDHDKGGRDAWIKWMATIAAECLRVLKPGGHALVWSLPRTSHWTATAWENAGFEPRDRIIHCFGSGFPKSLDVSKAIDKGSGNVRPVVDGGIGSKSGETYSAHGGYKAGEAISGEAKQWSGWGTGIKPAVEDWWLLRKPLSESTVAENVQKYGCGAINIDACRVAANGDHLGGGGCGSVSSEGWDRPWKHDDEHVAAHKEKCAANAQKAETLGRWPANLIHDGSDEVVSLFPSTTQSSARLNVFGKLYPNNRTVYQTQEPRPHCSLHDDSGSAARFFYCAKSSKRDRDEGCEGLDATFAPTMGNGIGGKEHDPQTATPKRNVHPCVKHTQLMRYLCRLITPPDGLILDPFMGSGSTGKAAILEGFRFVGIDKEPEYVEIAKARIKNELSKEKQTTLL